jgi:hypothetical protein
MSVLSRDIHEMVLFRNVPRFQRWLQDADPELKMEAQLVLIEGNLRSRKRFERELSQRCSRAGVLCKVEKQRLRPGSPLYVTLEGTVAELIPIAEWLGGLDRGLS